MPRLRLWLAPLALALVACSSDTPGSAPDAGNQTLDGGPDSGTADAGLPECAAQRVVEIVAGVGGLGWFSLVWPVPELIESPRSTFAYDDPTLATSASTDVDHPLYARKIRGQALWIDGGTFPQPTVLTGFANQTHTTTPDDTRLPSSVEVISRGATLQAGLRPPVPVVAINVGSSLYGGELGVPPALFVASVPEAVSQVSDAGVAASELAPSATNLTDWGVTGSTEPVLRDLADRLILSVNLFRTGSTGTVIFTALQNDPHGAFDALIAGPFVDTLTQLLDKFYRELSRYEERSCGHDGRPLKLSDNVVLVVIGDTNKNPFSNHDWGDGTPGMSSWIFVRSNGYLRSGWFGRISSSGATFYEPLTGALDAGVPASVSRSAGVLGILHAISRGNIAAVRDAGSEPFEGLIP